MTPTRCIALSLIALATAATGCQVDEITIGVGDARTEDSFGNPMIRPFDPDESLNLYRYQIERDKPEDDEDHEDEAQQQDPGDPDPQN